MSLFQTIKAAVTTRQAAESFGLAVSKDGMALCPFHDDHHPSLKLDKEHPMICIKGKFFTKDGLVEEAMEDSNNVVQFMASTGYIRLEEGTASRSVHLYAAYKRWCKDNLENPISSKSFSQFLAANQAKYGIRYSKHVLDDHRGFHNILVLIDPNKPGALDGAFLRNNRIKRPMRPSCPDPGRLGREGRVKLRSLQFLQLHHHSKS